MLMIASITALNITVAQTSIPRTLSIQGVLTSSFGSTPLKGKQVFRVGIYESPLGGLPLHEQIDTVLVGESGLYQFSLGGMTGLPRTVKFDKPYFIDISVNGEKQNMRIPLQSAAYAFMAGAVENEAIGVEQLSPVIREKIFPEDKKGEKALANYVNGFRAVIAGGDENRTSANYASILGGFTNSVSGAYGTITGGQSNQVTGNWAFVGGGQSNRALAGWTTVAGGNNNIVTSSANYGIISGGQNNQVGSSYGTISGGQNNISIGTGSTVAGGISNRAMKNFATASGGQNNAANGTGSVLVGGVSNTSSGDFAVISGGLQNSASGLYSTIAGGNLNKAMGTFTTVSGGTLNSSLGQTSTVSGGTFNTTNSRFSTIAGGELNTTEINAMHAVISGGLSNTIASPSSVIAGGIRNVISASSSRSVIGGGDTNTITHTSTNTSNNSIIDGGLKNTITNSNFSSIGGGSENNVTTSSDYSTIGGGLSSTITNSDYASISGGRSNTISSTSNYSAIGAGQGNSITTSVWSFIGSGNTNTIGSGSTASVIGGGEVNDIGTGATQSVIVGGYNNNIANDGVRSAIVGGINNDIADADWAFVGGGNNNDISASSNYSTIAGGEANIVNSSSTWSVIGGGRSNSIGSTNTYSFIGGGQENTTALNDDYATIVGGYSNGITGDRSTIVGGYNNGITGTNSFIGGGSANTISGTYSTISGGGGNNITHSSSAPEYATIAGGRNNTVSGNFATASGEANTIGEGANHALAIGNANSISASATLAVALGNGNSVTGTRGVAIGSGNSAGSNAMALGLNSSANANEFHARYSEGFYFYGSGDADVAAANRFTATFESSATLGNGINIKINNALPTNANDYIRFTDANNVTVGRIEGQSVPSKSDNAGEWATSDDYVRELALYDYLVDDAQGAADAAKRDLIIGIAKTVLGGVETAVAWADVGARFACGSNLFTLNCIGLGGSGIAEAVSKVAQVGQMVADVVQYSLNFKEANEGAAAAAKLKADWACNRFNAKGVTYESGSADYAEWLPKSSTSEKFIASDIVGIKNGKISKNTNDADHCMVISTKPIVLGNTPDAGKEKEFEKVAFMGQVPVRVMGKVELGDYILPSGKNNGLGIARKPKDLSPYEYRNVVGVAWSAGNSPAGVNIINVAVGLSHKTTAQVIEEQTDKIVLMERELDAAQAEIKNINDALVTLVPSYKEVRKLESNGTLIEMFKGLDFDKPQVVSARKMKKWKNPTEAVVSEQVADVQPDVNVVPLEEVERGYLEARQKFIDAGGDIESDPFYSRMERDPKYKEIMLQNINRMLNKSALEASSKSKPNN